MLKQNLRAKQREYEGLQRQTGEIPLREPLETRLKKVERSLKRMVRSGLS
jgi:hypothetical protein